MLRKWQPTNILIGCTIQVHENADNRKINASTLSDVTSSDEMFIFWLSLFSVWLSIVKSFNKMLYIAVLVLVFITRLRFPQSISIAQNFIEMHQPYYLLCHLMQ